MPDKYIKVSELREAFKARFNELRPKLERKDLMKIALETNKAFETVDRYINGTIADIRRLELAETIWSSAKEVVRLKDIKEQTAGG